MLDNFKQNFIRTIGIVYRKTIIAALIIDGKFLIPIFKIEPDFSYPIGNKSDFHRAFKLFGDCAQLVKKIISSKSAKLREPSGKRKLNSLYDICFADFDFGSLAFHFVQFMRDQINQFLRSLICHG